MSIEKIPYINLRNEIKKKKCLDLKQIFDDINFSDKVAKKIISLYKYAKAKNIDVINIDKVNAQNDDIKKLLNIFSISDIKAQYEYVYDDAIKYLDEQFAKNNYCKFENDVCICQRECKNVTQQKDGCSYTFHYRKFDGMPIHDGRCKELRPGGSCNVNSMACKMFTCKYLKEKGIRFNCDSIFLLRVWLNKKQKTYLENCFFIRKEKNIEKLLELNK